MTTSNNALPQSMGSRTVNNDIHSKGSTPSRQVEVSLGLDGVGSARRYMAFVFVPYFLMKFIILKIWRNYDFYRV